MKKLFYLILIFWLVLLFVIPFTSFGDSVKIFDTKGVPQGLDIDAGRGNIYVVQKHNIPADYYLYKKVAVPVISANATIGDESIQVTASTGVVVGHVITFYEGIQIFQSIVSGTTANTISFVSPLDFAYTPAALIESGLWSMAVDGSTTTQIFLIKAPSSAGLDIHTINVSMLDGTAMDDGTFGGLSALSPETGLLFRFVNGVPKNLAMLVNNIGFWEIGFITEYSLKAPAGQYGFRARRNIPQVNGVSVYLESGGLSEFQIHIRSDLSDLDLFACSVNGYVINDDD